MTFLRSSVLVLADNALASLAPTTLTSQIDILLDSHRIEDARELVDQHRRKLESNLTVDPDQAEELAYAYQVLGFKCFEETLFEDAGRYLFNGELDPRVLVSYYPDLRGALFKPDDEVDVFAGVVERMPPERSVDDIIRNYSPHLAPNTREAPSAVELRRILSLAAHEMLLSFLLRCRKRATTEAVKSDITRVVDTVLVKLYAHFDKAEELRSLLSEPNQIVLSEVESILLNTGNFSSLCNLYKHRNEEKKLLDIYAGLVEGRYISSEIKDPLNELCILLGKEKDRKQVIRWGLWILKEGGVDQAMKLLIPAETGKKKDREDDIGLLDQITEMNEEAGRMYLEYLVLQKRNMSPELHTRLALFCVEDLLKCLEDEETRKLWRAKTSSYTSASAAASARSASISASKSEMLPRSVAPSTSPSPPASTSPSSLATHLHLPSSTHVPPSPNLTPPSRGLRQQQSFVTYFASTTPDSTTKRMRVRAILMLSGSNGYDVGRVKAVVWKRLGLGDDDGAGEGVNHRSREEQVKVNLLALECAILEGKQGNHTSALEMLVYGLHDSSSAEVYCRFGGSVVPARVALTIAESCGLEEWYWGLFENVGRGGERRGRHKAQPQMTGPKQQRSAEDPSRVELLKMLFAVYMKMNDGSFGLERAIALTNSQGMILDISEVIELIPVECPIAALSTFLIRYFRRNLHSRQESMIVKGVCVGQNLAMKDHTWEFIREQGYIIEEPVSDGSDDEGALDKESALAENIVLDLDLHEKTPSPARTATKGYGEEEKSALGLTINDEGEGGGLV